MMAEPSVSHPEVMCRACGALGEMWVRAKAGLDTTNFREESNC